MPEHDRHLHFNVSTAIWFLVFFVVVMNLAKYTLNRWYVPGLTELVMNT